MVCLWVLWLCMPGKKWFSVLKTNSVCLKKLHSEKCSTLPILSLFKIVISEDTSIFDFRVSVVTNVIQDLSMSIFWTSVTIRIERLVFAGLFWLPASMRCHLLRLPDNSTISKALSSPVVALASNLPRSLGRTQQHSCHKKKQQNGAVFVVLTSAEFALGPLPFDYLLPELRAVRCFLKSTQRSTEYKKKKKSMVTFFLTSLMEIVIDSPRGAKSLHVLSLYRTIVFTFSLVLLCGNVHGHCFVSSTTCSHFNMVFGMAFFCLLSFQHN